MRIRSIASTEVRSVEIIIGTKNAVPPLNARSPNRKRVQIKVTRRVVALRPRHFPMTIWVRVTGFGKIR
jgi:hypothetical protein